MFQVAAYLFEAAQILWFQILSKQWNITLVNGIY